MRSQGRGESGAALLTVLLFMAVMMILITTMLTVAGNESVISGLHRDGLRALELAHAGVQEAISRIEAPHPFGSNPAEECYDGNANDDNKFANSLAATIPGAKGNVKVCRHEIGTSGAILEIQSDASVGIANRRVSQLVIQKVKWLLPDIMQGYGLAEQSMGETSLGSGDGYAQTFLRMQNPPDPASGSLLYAGWRTSKCANKDVEDPDKCKDDDAPCYTHEQCSGAPWNRADWFPGHRRTAFFDQAFRPNGQSPNLNSVDPRFFTTEDDPDLTRINFTCAGPGPGASPPPLYKDVKVSGLPGWAEGDNRRADKKPSENTMAAGEPAYGCDSDGLPYTWVKEQFLKEKTFDTKNPQADDYEVLWFKIIPFASWFEKYWVFCNAPDDPPGCTSKLRHEKTKELQDKPIFGAIPPFPDIAPLMISPDRKDTDGKIESGSDFGYCANPTPLPPDPDSLCQSGSIPKLVVLDNGDPNHTWGPFNGNDIKDKYGYGTLIVNGNLTTNGPIVFYGLIIVNGRLELGSGNATIYGGLIAKGVASLTGSITVYAGSFVGNVPVGAADVTEVVWWMR